MSETSETPGTKRREGNQVPVIERMLDMLEIIERRPGGTSIRELSEFLNLARSTVYRVLNTLEARDIVKRSFSGSYVLGPRLLSFAANVVTGHDSDLVELANTHLERLSHATGEASKLSVLDGDGVLVIAVAHSSGEYGLTVKPGRRLPLHAGAASRVLLAHMDGADIARILNGPLPRYTIKTLCDPEEIGKSLAQIRRAGSTLDDGEYSAGVMAVAAPVHDRHNKVVAAISIPFLHTQDEARVEKLRTAVSTAAKLVSAELRARLS
jgi:IclR family acetate operon transcriptional repressor